MKREGISTLFIRSYLRDLSFLLDYLLLFECACGFQKYFENVFVMVLASIRMRTKYCFEKYFKDVFVGCVF